MLQHPLAEIIMLGIKILTQFLASQVLCFAALLIVTVMELLLFFRVPV